jgi:hypothetical protein
MLKRFSYFAAYLLLVLMPMQALASASMLVCSSMQSSHVSAENTKAAVNEMPCHQHKTAQQSNESKSTSACKTTCANLCALIAMPMQMKTNFALSPNQVFDFNHQIYASIPQQNLQRPPITFI